MKKYRVKLSQEERETLERLTRTGKIAARKLKRVRILLLSNEAAGGPAKKDVDIAERVETSLMTIARMRKRYVQEGLSALDEKPRSEAPRTFDGADRAKVMNGRIPNTTPISTTKASFGFRAIPAAGGIQANPTTIRF